MGAARALKLQLLMLESFGKSNYMESFPQVFGEHASAYHFEIQRENHLAAFCASMPFHWTHNSSRYTGHCIGSVCSNEKFRGKGFASQAITLAEIYAAQCGAHFTFLFSELDAYYRKLGYESFGEERFAPIGRSPDNNHVARNNYEKIIKHTDHVSDIFRYGYTLPGEAISQEHKVALWSFILNTSGPSENILSFPDFTTLLSIPEVEVHTLWSAHNVEAVFFIGKGADFQNVAHSISYKNTKTFALLLAKYFEKFPGRSLLIMLPPGKSPLARDLEITRTPAYYAKILQSSPCDKETILSLLNKNLFYPRTFQSI